MSRLISCASEESLQILKSQGILVSRPLVAEIISSLLGYPTFAALVTECNERSDEPSLDEAEILVLDRPSAETKATAMLPAMSGSSVSLVVSACANAIAECSGVTVFDDVDELFDNWARRELEVIIENADGIDPALLRRMGPVEIDDRWTAAAPPWASRSEWVIEAKAEMHEADVVRDKPAVLDCVGYMLFRKAGRAGLLVSSCGASCALRVTP